LQAVYGSEIVERRGFECMVEMTMKMINLQLTISEVPLVLDTKARVGRSRMKIMRTIRGYLLLWASRGKWRR
jgi:dolichol-phosphate mannosyltransferase